MEWNVLSSSLISYLTKPKHFVDLESLFQCDFNFFFFFAAIMITEKKNAKESLNRVLIAVRQTAGEGFNAAYHSY